MDSNSNIHRSTRHHKSSGTKRTRKRRKGPHPKSAAYKELKRSRGLFLAAVIVSVFWFIIGVFKFHGTPIIEEVIQFLWLPMLIILFIIPIVCLLLLLRKKFNPKSYYFYSLIICSVTILYVTVLG